MGSFLNIGMEISLDLFFPFPASQNRILFFLGEKRIPLDFTELSTIVCCLKYSEWIINTFNWTAWKNYKDDFWRRNSLTIVTQLSVFHCFQFAVTEKERMAVTPRPELLLFHHQCYFRRAHFCRKTGAFLAKIRALDGQNSSYVLKKRVNSTRDILTTKVRKSTQF